MTTGDRPSDQTDPLRFYGRRKGQPLTDRQQRLLDDALPKYALTLDTVPRDLVTLFENSPDNVRMEIGFGGGEHLAAMAKSHSEIGYIGCEPFVNGVVKLLTIIEETGLHNIRIYRDDSRPFLEALPANSIAQIDLLYPDPWPKRRHWKRRFFIAENLDRMARVLKPGGYLRFATDIEDYVSWALEQARAQTSFEWVADKDHHWFKPWDGWPGTRYEAKAIREGRRPHYLTFRRV